MGGSRRSQFARKFGGSGLCGRFSRGNPIPPGEDHVGEIMFQRNPKRND